MDKEKIKSWLRMSVSDMLQDPAARRELSRMMINYCIANNGRKPPELLEEEFIEIIYTFAK
jgi:hypothetical protein